jgi:polysaccharide export outer membrane protein
MMPLDSRASYCCYASLSRGLGYRTTIVLLSLSLALPSVCDAQQPKPSTKPRAERARPAAVPEASPAAKELPPAAVAPAARAEEPLVPPVFEPVNPAKAYFLGPGDVVRVSVYQQPDMAMEGRVSEAGTLTIPLAGVVDVRGLTARQVEARIAYLLKRGGYVRDPQVNVNVLEFKSRAVSVLGYVNRPGRYHLEEGAYRVSDVLALAGGALPTASDVVTLVRMHADTPQRFDVDIQSLFKSATALGNLEVLPGDSLYVDRAPVFYIYGEVQRPGAFRLEKNMTLMQAVSAGGGLTLRGSKKDIQITRRDANGKVTTMTAQLGDQFVLGPDDVIYVKESLF